MKNARPLILATLLALSLPASADSIKTTAIRCRTEASCGVAWVKALEWVTHNSQYKTRMANAYVIDTFGPNDFYHGMGFMVQRVVIDGQIGIGLTTRCKTQAGIGGLFALECDTNEQAYLDSFVKFLSTEPPSPTVSDGSASK